ncbi:unnamed protein product, partial [Closterium sp. NIES-64]
MRVSAGPAASACSRDCAPRVPLRPALPPSARAYALASPAHLRCASACAPRGISATFSSGGRFPQQLQEQQQCRKQPASASPQAGLRSTPSAKPFAPACADVISPASAASAVAKAFRDARFIAGAASLAVVAAAAASGAAGPADGDTAKPAAEAPATAAAAADESSGSWWDRWKARPAGLKEKVAKLGLAAVLAYGLFDGITYTTFFVLAFLGYEKSTGLNPAANLKALLGIVVLMWTGNNVTRPFRVAGAAAVAPFLDKALKKFQEKLNLPNQFLAFALVAGRSSGKEALVNIHEPFLAPARPKRKGLTCRKVMLFSQGANRWIAPPTATAPSPPPSRPSSSPALDWSKPWAAGLTTSLPLNQSLTIVFTSSSSASSASAPSSPSSASPAFALQAPSGLFLAPSSPTPRATFAATAGSIGDAAAFVAEPAPGDPSSLLIRLASPPASYLTVSAPPASLLALHPPGSLPARPAYFRMREGMEVAAARGVNLGGWLVAEEWMEPGLFEGVPDVVDGVLVQLQAQQSGRYVSLWDSATGEGMGVNLGGWMVAEEWMEPGLFEGVPEVVDGVLVQLQSQQSHLFGFESLAVRASATSPSSAETFFLRLAPGPSSSPPLSLSSPSSSPSNVSLYIRAANGRFLSIPSTSSPASRSTSRSSASAAAPPSSDRRRGEWQLSQGLRATQGDEEAERRVKEHREGFVREEDLAYLSRQGVNTVRVPVGYWTVYGEGVGESGGTPFVGGGLAKVDQLFHWAEKHGVRVLFSLHGAHGSQNGYDHSGSQDGFGEFGRADSAYHVTATLNTIQLLAKRNSYAISFSKTRCACLLKQCMPSQAVHAFVMHPPTPSLSPSFLHLLTSLSALLSPPISPTSLPILSTDAFLGMGVLNEPTSNWVNKPALSFFLPPIPTTSFQSFHETSYAARPAFLGMGVLNEPTSNWVNKPALSFFLPPIPTTSFQSFHETSYAARPAFLGMGVLNEPTSNWVNSQALSSFYRRAYTAVRAASPCAYVGLSTYADTDSPFLKGLMTGDEHTNVLVDLHIYSVHAEKLRQMSLQQNLQFLTLNRSAEIRQYQEGNRMAMVGEWSLALPTDNDSD